MERIWKVEKCGWLIVGGYPENWSVKLDELDRWEGEPAQSLILLS